MGMSAAIGITPFIVFIIYYSACEGANCAVRYSCSITGAAATMITIMNNISVPPLRVCFVFLTEYMIPPSGVLFNNQCSARM